MAEKKPKLSIESGDEGHKESKPTAAGGKAADATVAVEAICREVGIDESRIDEMAKHVADNEGLDEAWAPLMQSDIAAIFRASL